MSRTSVLVADDSPEFAKMLVRFLAADPATELLGVASTGREACALAHELRPDLILMDLMMPSMNGLEATRAVKALPNAPLVIILTSHDTPEYRSAAADAGADGFVYKPELFGELLPLMRQLTALTPNTKPTA